MKDQKLFSEAALKAKEVIEVSGIDTFISEFKRIHPTVSDFYIRKGWAFLTVKSWYAVELENGSVFVFKLV